MSIWGTRPRSLGPARSVKRSVSCMTTIASDFGGIWIPASTVRSCTRSLPVAGVRSMGYVWCARPWAEPHSRFTALFERLAIDWLRAASQQAVADQLGLTWDEVHGIMERAVRRGLTLCKAEMIGYLGVDEKSFRKGHKYLTLVNDFAEAACCTWQKTASSRAWTAFGRR